MDDIKKALEDALEKRHAATYVLLAEAWLQDHPNDLPAIREYTTILYKLTRYDEAIRICKDAIARFPKARWNFCSQLGRLYRYRGDLAEAERWYREGIAAAPDEASCYIFLGAVHARQGKLKEAEATHRRATECSEGCIDEAYLNLGYVLRGQNRLAEAAECFRKAIELCPDYEEAVEALTDVTMAMILLD